MWKQKFNTTKATLAEERDLIKADKEKLAAELSQAVNSEQAQTQALRLELQGLREQVATLSTERSAHLEANKMLESIVASMKDQGASTSSIATVEERALIVSSQSRKRDRLPTSSLSLLQTALEAERDTLRTEIQRLNLQVGNVDSPKEEENQRLKAEMQELRDKHTVRLLTH